MLKGLLNPLVFDLELVLLLTDPQVEDYSRPITEHVGRVVVKSPSE